MPRGRRTVPPKDDQPKGDPPATPPTLTGLSARRFCIETPRGRRGDGKPDPGLSFRFVVSAPSTARYLLQRLRGGDRGRPECPKAPALSRIAAKAGAAPRFVTIARKRGTFEGGPARVWIDKLTKKRLKPGAYRLVVTATDARGGRSEPLAIRFWVLPAER
jgi:hypothetical protein